MATALTLHPAPRLEPAPPAPPVREIAPTLQGARVPDSLFERAGLVGSHLLSMLRVAIPGKLLLRGGHDPIAVLGATGSGRHTVADALHLAARDLLGRSGGRVDVSLADSPTDTGVLDAALRRARGGTLIVEGLGTLPGPGRRVAARLIDVAARRDDVLVIAVVDTGADAEDEGLPAGRPRMMWWPGTRLELPRLSQRGDDVRELVAHVLVSTRADVGGPLAEPCEDVVTALTAEARGRQIEAVGELRHLVRDVVFDAFARHGRPLPLAPADVARALGKDVSRHSTPDAAFEPPADIDPDMLARLANTHGIPAHVLAQQVVVLREVIARLDDAPRSYANILERAEDIKRAALWLWAGADSQASFRKAFGEQRHMQPSKSVSWAFYNRVFKREI